jgi:hypothetical protein
MYVSCIIKLYSRECPHHGSDVEAKRQAECRLRSELMEDELLQWRQEVDAYQRHSMSKAEETAQVHRDLLSKSLGG